MARLYNINYTIASQVNPHIVPFMQSDLQRYRNDVLSWPEQIIRHQGKTIALDVMDLTRHYVGRFSRFAVPWIMVMVFLGQRYYGMSTLLPNMDCATMAICSKPSSQVV